MVEKISIANSQFKASDSKTFQNMRNGAILAGVGGGSLSLLTTPAYKGPIKSANDITTENLDTFIINNDGLREQIDQKEINSLNSMLNEFFTIADESKKQVYENLKHTQETIFKKIEPYLAQKSPWLNTLKWTGVSAASGALVIGIFEEVVSKKND